MKSQGTTPSEQYLTRLCNGTFLRLWSYPNVFRDQRNHQGIGDGKELCDLLVVHGNDVIIFSDKSCQFPDTGDLKVDWCRWFRKSILKSAKQVYGAEGWIRQHPDKLYLDHGCTQKFPLILPAPEAIRFHRVVVALNAGDRCRRELGGSGGLMILPEIVGGAHYDSSDPGFQPFAVGQIDPGRGLVHVLDDVTLDVMLRELDTVTDFLNYLNCKETLVLSGRFGGAAEESDLLATYLIHAINTGQPGLPLPPGKDRLFVENEAWNNLTRDPKYLAKKDADKISYVWDHIIETLGGHAANGTLVYDSSSFVDSERTLRVMASESRFARRSLSFFLRGVIEVTPKRKDQIVIRTVPSQQGHAEGTVYVLVAMSNPGLPERGFRLYRRDYLSRYCRVVASKYKDVKRFIGLATEIGFDDKRSYDLVYLEPREWTTEADAEAKKLQEDTKMFTRANELHFRTYEYPPVDVRTPTLQQTTLMTGERVGRNDFCPCGSGKKFKKCCGT
jgi:hypothetical protein